MPRLASGLAFALLTSGFVLAGACGVPVVQPLDEAKRLEPTKAVPKDSKVKPAPTPAPSPIPEPEAGPYTRPGDRALQRDELTFWGFSADGRRYAFETYYYGPGAAECEGLATLHVVDADTDTFAEGSPLEIKHREPGAERCEPPDLKAEMARHRDELLHRHGIVVSNQGTAIVPNRDASRGSKPTWTLDLPGGPLRAELEVLFGGRENAGQPGGAYTLTLRGPGDLVTIVEAGKHRRPFVWDYSLDGGVAFLAPDSKHLAIVLTTKQLSFEGDRHSYMSNGLKTPTAANPSP